MSRTTANRQSKRQVNKQNAPASTCHVVEIIWRVYSNYQDGRLRPLNLRADWGIPGRRFAFWPSAEPNQLSFSSIPEIKRSREAELARRGPVPITHKFQGFVLALAQENPMKQDVLIRLLQEMAEIVDGPEGIGGGAILLEAACEIEDLQRRLPPADPSRP